MWKIDKEKDYYIYVFHRHTVINSSNTLKNNYYPDVQISCDLLWLIYRNAVIEKPCKQNTPNMAWHVILQSH